MKQTRLSRSDNPVTLLFLFATNPAYTGLGSFRRHDEEQCDMRDWRF